MSLTNSNATSRALRLTFFFAAMLAATAPLAHAQMRPMTDVTVGQREAQPTAQPAARPAAQPAVPTRTATPAKSATVTKATEATAATASPAAPARKAPAPETNTTRSRRVSVQPAAQVSPAPRIDADEEPPVMPAAVSAPSVEAKKEAANDEREDEAKGTDRLSALRARIADATDDRERARLRRTLIDYLISLDQKREALNELRAMMREERFDPVGLFNIGNVLARLGDTDTAIDAYRKAVSQRHGNYARALNNLGVMLLRQGRWDEAEEPLMQALRQENYRYAEASYNLGRLYAARGAMELAVAEWTRTLRIEPDHADAALALARAYAAAGNPARGLEVLDQFTGSNVPPPAVAEARKELAKSVAAAAASAAAPAAQTKHER